jgi:hypothetical protein
MNMVDWFWWEQENVMIIEERMGNMFVMLCSKHEKQYVEYGTTTAEKRFHYANATLRYLNMGPCSNSCWWSICLSAYILRQLKFEVRWPGLPSIWIQKKVCESCLMKKVPRNSWGSREFCCYVFHLRCHHSVEFVCFVD